MHVNFASRGPTTSRYAVWAFLKLASRAANTPYSDNDVLPLPICMGLPQTFELILYYQMYSSFDPLANYKVHIL